MSYDPKCAANYFAPWAVEELWFSGMVDAFNAGKLEARVPTVDTGPLYTMSGEGVGVIRLVGHLMKGVSKFGESTSTVQVRQALRAAVADEEVQSILLAIDSPGGTVAGTASLANSIRTAGESKPVYALIEDLGASAAYWAASQAHKVLAVEGSLVGSIGTLMILQDSSRLAENMGVRVITIKSGEFKGAGTPGTPVTEGQIDYFQELVDSINAGFLAAVKQGRRLNKEQLAAISTAKVMVAEDAMKMGLIDGISSTDQVISDMSKMKKKNKFMMSARDFDLALKMRG